MFFFFLKIFFVLSWIYRFALERIILIAFVRIHVFAVFVWRVVHRSRIDVNILIGFFHLEGTHPFTFLTLPHLISALGIIFHIASQKSSPSRQWIFISSRIYLPKIMRLLGEHNEDFINSLANCEMSSHPATASKTGKRTNELMTLRKWWP